MFDFFFNKKETIEVETKYIYTPIDDFSDIFEVLYNLLGISDLTDRPIVKDRLSEVAEKYQIETSEGFLNKLKTDKVFNHEVIDSVTINETFFLRETHNLEWIVEYISNKKEKVRLLSIPSSSGEEIYSILILLHKKNPDLLSKVEITGIDINQKSIDKALKGIYTERSLHYMEEDLKEKYFKKSDEGYTINSLFQDKVTFFQENIFNLHAKGIGTFDIVLSRNLFIYFDKEYRSKATDILIKLLKKDAILLIGHADKLEDTSNILSKIKNSTYQNIMPLKTRQILTQ